VTQESKMVSMHGHRIEVSAGLLDTRSLVNDDKKVYFLISKVTMISIVILLTADGV
jgi:hypothetical protein